VPFVYVERQGRPGADHVPRHVELARTFRAVLRVQSDPESHPLTCGNCSPPNRDDFPLVPWVDPVGGALELRCPLGCGWRQPVTGDLARLVRDGARQLRRRDVLTGVRAAGSRL
jgi:hypothetical protein